MEEFIIIEALFKVILSISTCLSVSVSDDIISLFRNIWIYINSTIITAPSMMIPKSMAPILIKLASILKIFIKVIANNKLKGITDETTSPERKLPSNKTTIKMTIKEPKIKFSATVVVVFSIRLLRYKNPLI